MSRYISSIFKLIRFKRKSFGRYIDFSNSRIIRRSAPPAIGGPVIGTPQDISISELILGEVTVTWTDIIDPVDGYKVYRRLTIVGGSWGIALDSIAEGVELYIDNTVASMTAYDYKVVAYIGGNETIPSIIGENQSSIITVEIILGLLFEHDNNDYLKKVSGFTTLVIPFSVKMGIQGLNAATVDLGPFGYSSGSGHRIIYYPGTPFIRMNIAGSSLKTSPTIDHMDLVGRKIIEYYIEASGDCYYVDFEGDTPQFLYNIDTGASPTFILNQFIRSGDKRAEGYLYCLEIDNDGIVEIFDIEEGSGAIVTGSLATVYDIMTDNDLSYINNIMWGSLPAPAGFVPFTSLSAGGRPTDILLTIIEADPGDYTVGTVNYQIAGLYNIGNHNPEGYTHAIITTITNDIANVGSAFATTDEYEIALTGVVQRLKTAGIIPIIAFSGSMVTSIKQAQKDYDPTIGAMLSGDPMNPTPESEWDFNVADVGIEAVIPLYVAKANAVAIAESVTFIDTFQHFIDGQSAPYDSWISADGIHFSDTGYTQYGIAVATVLDTLGWTGVEKVCVLGDSLGNGETTAITAAYN